MTKNVKYFTEDDTIQEILTKPIEVEEKIPDEMPKYVLNDWIGFTTEDLLKESRIKELYHQMGMFGFVSWRWIEPLTEWIGKRKCLEVMAGRGWLSYALREKGVDIIATDNFSWHKTERYQKWKEIVTPIEELDAVEAIETYGKDIDFVIMSWAYMDDTAYRVLAKLHAVNPKAKVIYIGEGPGGCTADTHFFKHFKKNENDRGFNQVSEHYQNWHGLHDKLMLGEYKD